MISVQNLGMEFSARPLFGGASFVINDNDKISLAGKNGAGKSTLLKILSGLQSPTTGSISKSEGLTIGYLPQQMKLADDTTLVAEVKKVFEESSALRERMEEINLQIASRTDYESESYASLITQYEQLTHRLKLDNPARMEGEIEKTLIGLGFERKDFCRSTSEFSGGWRMRIELAKILLINPDLLLLDEPTNHLDIESIQWLEQFIKRKSKAVVLVSHDKKFMDNVTSRTIEISCGKLYDYKVNYSHYVELRKERVEQQMRAYQNQQKQIAEIKDFIARFRYKPTKANQVQSRIKQLDKIVPVEVDEVDRSHVNLKFPPAPHSGEYPVIAENVGKAFGEHRVFSDATFTIRRGEKVAFVGRNGEGKSTMVKCIMNQLDHEGTLKIGHNVKIGYFAQNQAQLLDEDITVFDTIDRVAVGDIRTRINDILGAFMFGGEESEKKVKVLSGGEKTRLAMIRLLLEPVNLLILDEPTNHLDIKTKDVLKQALISFEGTVILVSHDRDFLDGIAEKVYEFREGKVKEYLGGVYDFIRSRQLSDLTDVELPANARQEKAIKSAPKNAEPAEPVQKPARLSYAEIKENKNRLRKALRILEEAEKNVEKFDGEISLLEQQLAAGDASSELLDKYDKIKKEQENAMSVWELAQTEYDQLRKSTEGQLQ